MSKLREDSMVNLVTLTQPIQLNAIMVDGVPVIGRAQLPVYEILQQLAISLPEELVLQNMGLALSEVQAALNYALGLIPQPAKSAEAKAASTTQTTQTVDLDLNHVLVVDDVIENRFLIQYMFKDSEFKLSLASSGQEALEKARTVLPGLVISDIQMPKMSGLELLSILKSDELTKNMGVILLTAHHRGSNEVSDGLTMGADDYIKRPFMKDEFMSRVRAVVRLKRAEAKAQSQTRLTTQRNNGLQLVNELALVVNSSLNLEEILAVSLQKLSTLTKAEVVVLLLLNENKELVITASSVFGQRVSQVMGVKSLDEIHYLVKQKEIIPLIVKVLADCQPELNLKAIPPGHLIHYTPMLSREQEVGVIAVVNKQGEVFDEIDWQVIHSAAAIIAVAIENAYLLEGVQQQVDDLIALNEIGQALTSTFDLNQILKQTTTLIQNSLQSEVASLWLLDVSSQQLELTASSGIGADVLAGFRLPSHQGIAGHVIETGETYIAEDVSEEDHYFKHVANKVNYQPKAMLCVPLQVKGEIIGVMQVMHQQPNWFNYQHLRLVQPVASSIGIAVENARLFAEVQKFNRHLEQMVIERTRLLADEKEKTEAILASMADGLLVFDADNHILMANQVAEAMLEFKLKDLVGLAIEPKKLVHPLWRCISDIVQEAKPNQTHIVDIFDQSGNGQSIQAHSAEVKNEHGEDIGTVIVLSDLTALKEVERVKARFMTGITHELKTPLSIIKLQAKNLLNYHDRLPSLKRVELLNAIESQTNILTQLVENILELSQFDATTIKMKAEPLNLGELLDETILELKALAETKQINLKWKKPAAQLMVLGDKNQLKRVIVNLVENGIKYTQMGGVVEVENLLELTNSHAFVIIQVVDTGIGIPLEHQPRIFERFYRVDSAHTIPGTGLGLAIVKEIIDAHHGKIELNSLPNKGSTFVVKLPALVSQ